MKIGFLITARLKSSRLPLKLLLDLNGKSIVERVIERAKKVAYVEDVVLCTSTNPQDKPLIDIALKNDIYYYLGSEEDVVQRLFDSAKFFGMDFFVNITGENPLFSIEYANQVAEILRSGKHDFIYVDGLPIGCAVYGLRTKAFEVVCQVKKEIDTEIWGTLINRPEVFEVLKIEASPQARIPEVERVTTDYLEDYYFISELFNHFPENIIPSYHAVKSVLSKHPELANINAKCEQLALSTLIQERIDDYFDANLESILKIKNNIYNQNN